MCAPESAGAHAVHACRRGRTSKVNKETLTQSAFSFDANEAQKLRERKLSDCAQTHQLRNQLFHFLNDQRGGKQNTNTIIPVT